MGIESRRQPRRAVSGRVEVYDTILEETIGHLGNLSAGGMLLIANRALPDDALFQFRFSLPGAGGEPLEVGAHVLWQEPAGTPGQHWVGMRFLGLAPDVVRHLRAWIASPPP